MIEIKQWNVSMTRDDLDELYGDYHQVESHANLLEEKLEETCNILYDFITTKEDAATWRAEMWSTIKEVLDECNEHINFDMSFEKDKNERAD